MGRRVRIGSALAAATLAFVVVGTSTAHAILSKTGYKCQTAIAKEGANYFNKKLKLLQKCKNANLAASGACTAPAPEDLQKLVDKLDSGLAKACGFDGLDADNLARLGFPGPCPDISGSGNGFTLGDLQNCIQSTTDKALAGLCGGGANLGEACTTLTDCPDQGAGTYCRGLFGVEYDSTVTSASGTTLKCQEEVAKDAAKFSATLFKSVQKCRNALLNCKNETINGVDKVVCKLDGLTGPSCATNDQKTSDAIAKARQKALDGIGKKCTDADAVTLKLCEPDQSTASTAATCEVDTHQLFIDNPDPTTFNDLIDYEYAQRGVCGDNRKNQPTEECDGNDATACPGLCGAFDSNFPCLCENLVRTRVIEHSNADLDNGWSGQSHDSGVVEGGGYVTDLWDCDGPGGPDTICQVGPSCNLPPHQACNPNKNANGTPANADSICTGVGNFCRKTAGGATGPHCEIEFKKRCQDDLDCTTPGDRCDFVAHGSPLPLSSGGVSVCVVNTFTEDVTGTTNLATGDSSIRLRQDSSTYQGGAIQQPCPVCGGFCSGPGGATGPNARNLCSSNADCTGGAHCILDSICSWGPNIDQPCRPNTPGGGATQFFGNPSVDCPMNGQLFGTIDILFNPATTASTSLVANLPCNSLGFNDKRCESTGGGPLDPFTHPNNRKICTSDADCADAGLACKLQCFCPNGQGESQKPTGCQAACLGGADDASPCTSDADCTAPGFCNPGDCRPNTPPDNDSAQEGVCTVGPFDKVCSTHTFKTCSDNSGCAAPACPYCNLGETCINRQRECFVAPIQRAGTTTGYVPVTHQERTTASIFCITASGSAAVDSVAGLPGPGAITQPTNSVEVGF